MLFEVPEKNIYRVKDDHNVETITISACLDDLVLCNLPNLKQIKLEAPIENAIIENCPKLEITCTPANHTRISGCDAITRLSVDAEECEISNCGNLEEVFLDSYDCDYGMSVSIKNCNNLYKVHCDGREEIDLKMEDCDALCVFENESEHFPNLDIYPNYTTLLKTVPCRGFNLGSFGYLKALCIGSGSIFDIIDINDSEQFKNMVVDSIELSIDCSNLEDLESVRIANGTNISEANFSGCKNLRSLYIGDSTHCDFKLNLMGCPISDIDLPWGNYDLNMNGCKNVKQLSIPTKDFSCCDCTNLEEVDLNEETTYITDCAFQNCRKLTSIELPECLETICDSAFENCSQLKEIVLPETVEEIKANAFKGCTSLERVVCKNPYIEIGSKAFAGCANLKEVEGLELGCILAEDAFEGCEQLQPITFEKVAAIVGSRSFADYETMKNFIDETCREEHIVLTGIVSGGAKGADTYGALYAKEHNLPLTEFIPDWDKHDKKATILRNIDIVDNCDICFAFWDGQSHGTKFTVQHAREHGKNCYVYTYGEISC